MRFFHLISIVFVTFILIPGSVLARLPNDPYVNQWGWNDTKVYEAWDTTVGSREVIVAIIDNGFDTFHPDLSENVWRNEDELFDNGIDDDKNGYVDDVWGWNFVAEDTNKDGIIDDTEKKGNNNPRPEFANGLTPVEIEKGVMHHGTVVAGIVGAIGNNNLLGAGLNWRVRLMNIKVIGNGGSESNIPFDKAIRYAVDNGAHIINFSIVTGEENARIQEAIQYAYNRGVILVAAAGNSLNDLNTKRMYPVCSDADSSTQMVLGVSAMTEDHHLAIFSNSGSDCIDITAPGVHVSSTIRFSPSVGLTEKYGGGWNGTSFAAPFVSGAAALIKSLQPKWSPSQIYETLLGTVHKTPPANEAEYANLFGKGLLQINKAIALAASTTPRTFPTPIAMPQEPETVMTMDRVSGLLETTATNGIVVTTTVRSALKQADVVLALAPHGATGFVVLKKNNLTSVRVELYDGQWGLRDSWLLPWSSVTTAVIGNVRKDAGPELIVSNGVLGEAFRIYNLSGKELERVSGGKEARTLSLAVTPGDDSGMRQIVTLVDNNGVSAINEFTAGATIAKYFSLPDIAMPATVGVGDIAGDDAYEYIVAAGPGALPVLAYVGGDGRVLRQFYAYDSGYRGGMALLVTPSTWVKKSEVVTIPLTTTQETRVWNHRSQILASWPVLADISPERQILGVR